MGYLENLPYFYLGVFILHVKDAHCTQSALRRIAAFVYHIIMVGRSTLCSKIPLQLSCCGTSLPALRWRGFLLSSKEHTAVD